MRPGGGSARDQRPNVRAVERAIDILAAVGEHDMRLIELSTRLGLHKASVARLADTLVSAAMLSRDASLRYSVGPRFVLLAGQVIVRYRRAAELLREPLQRLWEVTRETVAVHVRVGLERLCIAELPTPQPLGYRTGIGTRAPLHAGATSKALIAFLPDGERRELLARLSLDPVTMQTVTDSDVLMAQLDEIRGRGFAVSASEHISGGSAVSVPVFDATGRVAAAVSIHGPESRLTDARLQEYATLLIREIRPLAIVVEDG